jgi:hypothetical protein
MDEDLPMGLRVPFKPPASQGRGRRSAAGTPGREADTAFGRDLVQLAVPNVTDDQRFGLGLNENYSLARFKGLIWYYEAARPSKQLNFSAG